MILMAIDPSINNLGVAIFAGKKLVGAELLHPEKIYKSEEHYVRSYSLFLQNKQYIKDFEVEKIICELPEYWAVGGYAARESGAIFKLTFICGMIYTLFSKDFVVEFVVPRAWKGQLPKDVVRYRLTSHYVKKTKDYTSDEWEKLDHNVVDAIGVGHWKTFGRV
jgi:hypothetical protein